MTTFSDADMAKKFALNGIDIPLPAPTPVYTPGSGPATVVYQLETEVDYAFPILNLIAYHEELDSPVDEPISSIVRQITIKGGNAKSKLPEPLVIDGPALPFIPAAACALTTRLGEMPNYNSLYTDCGFGSGDEANKSEAYIALPAVLRPGKYLIEVQYNGYQPAGVSITNRGFRVSGCHRELAQAGVYFACAAKRVINTNWNAIGLGNFKGNFILIGNPAVNGGIYGGYDSDRNYHDNVALRYDGGFMPTNEVVKEGVKFYLRAMDPQNTGEMPQVYQYPWPFKDLTLTRSTVFDVTVVHLCEVN